MHAENAGVIVNSPFNNVTINEQNINSFPPELIAELLAALRQLAADPHLEQKDQAKASELSTELDEMGGDQSRLRPFLAKVGDAAKAAGSGFDAVNSLLKLFGHA